MSKEVLNDVLNKIAEITKVLIEASEIKESFNEQNNLNVSLQQTKTLINKLYTHTYNIREQFFKECPDGLIFDEIGDTDIIESSQTRGEVNKPVLKLVDINKLVEPKTIIKKEATVKEKKTVQFDSSVVIISSSDEESSPRKTRRSHQKEKINSKFEKLITRRKQSKFNRRHLQVGEDTSDSSSETSNEISESRNKNNRPINKYNRKGAVQLSLDDKKLNCKCFIKLLRIPCEQLKECYTNKLENMEIKRLTNLNTLKRNRRNNDSLNSTDSDNTKKITKREKKKSKVSNSINSDSSDSEPLNELMTKDNDEKVPSTPIEDENDEGIPSTPIEDGNEELANLALDQLNDKLSSSPRPSDENIMKNNKEDEIEGVKLNGKPDDKPEKHIQLNKNEHSKKSIYPSEDAQEKDKNLRNDTKLKDGQKDKLLTGKLNTSDSEEDFASFCKRKNKTSNELLSDDEIKIPQDKKRKAKKKLKTKILSDSESEKDNNSSSDNESSNNKSSSESEDKPPEETKRTRKRVKRMADSSSDDDEKTTRKQIRKVWGRESLAETTKQAENEEKERKARILEKQKKYNKIFEVDPEMNATVDKVILDFDEKTKKELLKVNDRIVKKLKPHQVSGIQFMWDACFESIERAQNTKGSGCILAHCMGLGKTLQVIALTHTLLVNKEVTKVHKILVVCPLSTVLNWVNEFNMWLPDGDDIDIYELVSCKQNFERQYKLQDWHHSGGVLIIGYDMFRNLSNPENKRMNKKMRKVCQETMVDPGPDLVICDEGHLLKNEKTNLSIAMNRLKTLRRIVLTGTPLQNNLKEYFCMVQFIKPSLLGTYKEYLNRFVNPITNGQYTDSTLHDTQIMRKRSHVLHKLLDGVVQRRDYAVLQPYLPPKHEYVLFLTLTETQIKLYEHYMTHFARRSQDGSNRTSFIFVDFQELQRICTHPRVLLDKSIEMKNAKEKMDESDESEGSIKDFINDDDEDTTSSSSSSGESDKDVEEKQPVKKRMTRANAALINEDDNNDEILEHEHISKEWWQEYCDGEELDNILHSNKLFLLFEILKECEQIGDKVLVFSQSLYSLNIIEYFLSKIDEAAQNDSSTSAGGFSGSWSLGLDYFRLDGSSSCDNRNAWCKTFNNPSNTRARLFLISTRAGGLGINLVAANRVIIFDVSWNPSHDIQSIYRVYRFGQTKPCYIYRFVTYGTMEMKIYERQVIKQSISKRVIDEQQIDRHYNQNDIQELYRFEPRPENRPIPLVPKDVLLGEMLQKYDGKIYKYHEHQSLLENKEEECLNEEERKAAWEEFENEKTAKNNFSLGFPMMMSPQLLAAALTSMIRKEHPNWTNDQVTSLLPNLTQLLQGQMAAGDMTLFTRVQNEIKMLQAIQAQRLKDQIYQQQAMRYFQQQQLASTRMGMPNFTNAFNNIHNIDGQIPGPSSSTINMTPSEIVDLDD